MGGRPVRYLAGVAALLALRFACPLSDDGALIASMDQAVFRSADAKARVAVVPGKAGSALQFSFDEGYRGFCTSSIHGTPEWDRAAGFSFWVKGDGSDAFGGLEFIYAEDYSVRYDYMFPIRSKEWTKIVVPWRDLIPVLPGPKCLPLDPRAGNKPSALSALWIGKWWYWGEYPAHSFAVDEIRLEPTISLDHRDYRPAGAPLARVLAKLQAHKPVTIVTVGDSLTDYHHWSNREVSWPRLLAQRLKDSYGADVTIVNPAIGGTQLRQNLVLMPRWLAKAPHPDLVTVCFGFNDWDAGMRGPEFAASYRDAIDRIRRATHGESDVLIFTTLPSVERWRTMAELAEACRTAAADRNAGLADTERAFLASGQTDKERLYGFDRTHLSPAGHEVIADAVLKAIAAGGKAHAVPRAATTSAARR